VTTTVAKHKGQEEQEEEEKEDIRIKSPCGRYPLNWGFQ